MKVAIVSGGRWSAFDAAREFARRGELSALVTNYIRAPLEGVPLRMLRWSPFRAVRQRLVLKYSSRPPMEVHHDADVAFGRWAARHLPEADILQAWTGFALEPMRVARSRGMIAVALRASAHITTQRELVQREFDDFGVRSPVVLPAAEERELREYDEANYIQVISTFALSSFLAQGVDRERLLLVPNTIADVDEVRLDSRPPAPPGPLRVLCLGHVSLRKGTRYLLEAARRLGPGEVSISLVGGLAEEGQAILDRFARPGEYRGKVSRAGLRAVFAAHDVLVVPSIEDGGPATIPEAMAAGLPVIVTTNTFGPDLVEEGVTGLIVPPGDADAIADRLATLAANRNMARAMGEAAGRLMKRAQTVSHWVEQMSSRYAEVLAGRDAESRYPRESQPPGLRSVVR
jgi:glycosyltransferase involved in cell wall biosynthesis